MKPVDQGKGPKGNREVLLGDAVHTADRSLDQVLRVTAGLRYRFLRNWPAQARLSVVDARRLVWSAPGSEGPQATVPLFWKGRSFGIRASLI